MSEKNIEINRTMAVVISLQWSENAAASVGGLQIFFLKKQSIFLATFQEGDLPFRNMAFILGQIYCLPQNKIQNFKRKEN